ncbi:MAG: hypothetical protein JST39_06585 [Bacteroidetes bacterium]|nr:hypothetical protein [Bacteroidota bacterium]
MKIAYILLLVLPGLLQAITAPAQRWMTADTTVDEVYYIGINPVAPFTSIHTEMTSRSLPIVSNLETGFAAFGGKIWNRHYNLETRFAYGSPAKGYRLMLVQSSFHYCFNSSKPFVRPYAGMFAKLYSLVSNDSNTEQSSVMGGVSAGCRLIIKRFFADARVSENVAAISWSSLPHSPAGAGFPPSIYKWDSPYIPYAAIGIGYLFR